MMKSNVSESENEVVITRVFDAPRSIIWKAWTDPEMMMQWWGPKGFTAIYAKIDLRVGGKILNCMRSPDGKDYWGTGVYREIDPPKRLVVTDSFADKDGNVVPASYYGMGVTMPLEMLVTLTFEEQGGKTNMTLKHSNLKGMSNDDRKGLIQGWSESFDKLEEALAKTEVIASQPA